MTKMLKTSARGRKCMFPNCERTLSIYNHEDYCHMHLDKMIERRLHPPVNPSAEYPTIEAGGMREK